MISVGLRLFRSLAFRNYFTSCAIFVIASTASVGAQTGAMRPVETAPSTESNNPLRLRQKPVRVDVDLVLVPVSVTDALNHPVDQLSKEDFRIFEEDTEQTIRLFASEDAPLSVGLVLDVSGSMADKIGAERDALEEFAKLANPEDAYFAISVSGRPILLSDWTRSIDQIRSKLAAAAPTGYTPLMDAIYLALNKLRSGPHSRKALLIISDGGENDSRYKTKEIRNIAKESDVLIYAIRPSDMLPVVRSLEERFGTRTLAGITDASGGRTITVIGTEKLPEAAATISKELRSQYVLGYQPAGSGNGWRKIKVTIGGRGEHRALHPHYRHSYYANGNPGPGKF